MGFSTAPSPLAVPRKRFNGIPIVLSATLRLRSSSLSRPPSSYGRCASASCAARDGRRACRGARYQGEGEFVRKKGRFYGQVTKNQRFVRRKGCFYGQVIYDVAMVAPSSATGINFLGRFASNPVAEPVATTARVKYYLSIVVIIK